MLLVSYRIVRIVLYYTSMREDRTLHSREKWLTQGSINAVQHRGTAVSGPKTYHLQYCRYRGSGIYSVVDNQGQIKRQGEKPQHNHKAATWKTLCTAGWLIPTTLHRITSDIHMGSTRRYAGDKASRNDHDIVKHGIVSGQTQQPFATTHT